VAEGSGLAVHKPGKIQQISPADLARSDPADLTAIVFSGL
jgi:hypothetical protein